MLKKILLFFISWKGVVLFFAFLATLIIPLLNSGTYIFPFHGPNVPYNYQIDPPYYFWIWANFDGSQYISIARSGYLDFQYGFFPFYPLLISFFTGFFHTFRYLKAGLLISNLSLLGSLMILAKLISLDKKKHLFSLMMLTVLFFPSSFFYGAVYNDSLFFFIACLTIYFARKKSFFLASLTGAIATITRLNGLVLFFLIVFEYFFPDDNIEKAWDLKQIVSRIKSRIVFKQLFKSKIISSLLIPISFIGYLIYIQYLGDSWTTLFTSMKIWHQDKPTFPLQVLWRYVKILFTASPHQLNYWVAMCELFFVLFYVTFLIYSFRKIRLSYWIFFALSILIPAMTGTFQGMPRYGLHLYPLFLSLTIFLEKKPLFVKISYFTLCLILLFILLALFTRGYFVA